LEEKMKRRGLDARLGLLIACAAMFLFVVSGCATGGMTPAGGAGSSNAGSSSAGSGEGEAAAQESTDSSAGAKGGESGWSLELIGAVEETVTEAEFDEAKGHSSHYRSLEFEEKGETVAYTGMPLWYLIAMIDDREEKHPYDLDDEQWKAGYDVTFTASDGYSATFNTAEVGRMALYVADSRNGEEIPPRIVGEASKSLWVKNLSSIEAFVEPPEEDTGRADFELKLEINETTHSFSISELEGYPYYVEGPGSYTTSAGTTYSYTYGGIKLEELLSRYIKLKPDSSVTFVAMDGYEMTYTGKEILEPGEGTWILAFKRDGEYLPKDPGYIRTVKVGDGTPNILGHKSVKMVEKIEVQGEGFKSFSLEMKGKMDFSLERHTLQSGVSCHKRTVDFSWKGEEDRYTGIPLYLLLAYSDDPQHAPHKQKDKSILSYKADAAKEGYTVKITAADGYSIELDSRELHENDDVIIAMYKNGEILPEREWPLIIVWDKNAETVPDGIKPVRNISSIELLFE
jgi:DMSO/TMAO reductase YedYZ molybdopterin-dependent catalytic subunit